MRILSIILALMLTGCSGGDVAKIEYKKITPDEAAAIMADESRGNSIVILDVRTQEEFDEGHIKNAILLPDYEIKNKAEITLYSKDEVILVYCRTGRRSENAAKELIAMGYTNVYDFGGIGDWTGEIVVENEQEVEQE